MNNTEKRLRRLLAANSIGILVKVGADGLVRMEEQMDETSHNLFASARIGYYPCDSIDDAFDELDGALDKVGQRSLLEIAADLVPEKAEA